MFISGSFRRAAALVLAGGVWLGGLGGCAAPPAPDDGKPQVIAAIYPLAWLAGAIAGPRADVVTLVPPGTEPHDYELTPRQLADLRTAAVVVYQQGVTAAADEAITQAAPAHLVETGQLVTRLPLPEGETEAAGQYGADPHTWLDPNNMVVFAGAIADALAAADPAGAADYQAGAAAVREQLTGLDDAFRSGLTGCARTTFLTTHAAFGYLAKAYGLTQLAIAGLSPEDEPSPRHLGELAAQARSLGLTTVFFETLISPDYAETLADDLSLRTDVLDPIEAVTPASRGADYLTIMQANLSALRTANACP